VLDAFVDDGKPGNPSGHQAFVHGAVFSYASGDISSTIPEPSSSSRRKRTHVVAYTVYFSIERIPKTDHGLSGSLGSLSYL
jgi:hypothetical protein